MLQVLLGSVSLRARSVQLLVDDSHLALNLVGSVLDDVEIRSQLLLCPVNDLLRMIRICLAFSNFFKVFENLSNLLLVGGDALFKEKQ